MAILWLLLLLASPALAQSGTVTAIDVSEPMMIWQEHVAHSSAYNGICIVDGEQLPCQVSVRVARDCCVCLEPGADLEKRFCRAVDLDGSGTIDAADFIRCSALEGDLAKACGALVQVYWSQTCEDLTDD